MEEKFEISEDLQRDILSLIITDRNFLLDTLSILKPDYFTDFCHQIICTSCQEYFKEYNSPITKDIIINEIDSRYRSNSQYARILTEIDIILERQEDCFLEKEYLKKSVIDFAKTQAIKKAIFNSIDLINERKYQEIEKLIQEALLISPDISLGTDLFDDVTERYRKIQMEMQGEKFTTGWRSVDIELNGGMSRKEVGLIFANSGVGKSIYCSKASVENLLRNKNVLYISCEMSEERVLMRIESMLTHIPINQLTYNVPNLKERLSFIKDKIKSRLKVKEFPAGTATIADFRAYANQLYSYTGFQPDMIVLDYLDEVKCSNSRLSTYEAQYQTAREYRAWMSMDNLCGLTATQANRTGRQVQVITESEIGDSYPKIRVVDYAWSLNQTDEEKVKNLARLYVVKHRNGKSRYLVYVQTDPYTLSMKEISLEEYTQINEGEAPSLELENEV